MNKSIIGAGLVIITTVLAIVSFRIHHRDFFYLMKNHSCVTAAHRTRVVRIANRVDVNDQRNAAVSMLLGEALVNVGEVDRGIETIETQVRLHPDDSGIIQGYADMLAKAGRRSQADIQYRRLLQHAPGRKVTETTEDPT